MNSEARENGFRHVCADSCVQRRLMFNLVNVIVLCSFLELALSQSSRSWPQPGGNAQHTGVVVPAIGTSFNFGNGSTGFGGPQIMRSSLLMSRAGVLYLASVATEGYVCSGCGFFTLSFSHA